MLNTDFFKGKKVLITGHTGFKGTWLCKTLCLLGADVVGYSLGVPTEPSLFNLSNVEKQIVSIEGDIRDLSHLRRVFEEHNPEIVMHLAAQPIVRESYNNPVYTYDVNVMGTVNVLECVRNTKSVKSFLNITTDKVYKNNEWCWGYREDEELNGYDPYSNSKSCSELVTDSYKKSFFTNSNVAISTARAGNVVGGGDFAIDRIIPDCIRAVKEKKAIVVRNPNSTRPYQHVLEALSAYLLIVQAQYENINYQGAYNVGPDEDGCWKTGELVDEFCRQWKFVTGNDAKWVKQENSEEVHEANFLRLDSSKIKSVLKWKSCWNFEETMEKIVEWYGCYIDGNDVEACMEKQIREYFLAKE